MIVVLGNLGDPAKPDGQTIRTKTVLESIQENYGKKDTVHFLDVGGKKLCKLFVNRRLLKQASCVVILPGRRAIGPMTAYLDFLKVSNKVVHVAIGGWLPVVTKENVSLQKREKTYRAILVQMASIRDSLCKQGFSNVSVFPNYRNVERTHIMMKTGDYAPQRFVFYSRVIKEKGVLQAIGAVKQCLSEGVDASLDIYGPVDEEMKNRINLEIKECEAIQYSGVLHGEEILPTLAKYDVMLFPTAYRGEGFPGAILEAMMAGLPVIATDWKYNGEIVKDGETGLLCKEQSISSVYEAIKRLRDDLDLYKRVCQGAYLEAEKYSKESVTKVLFETIDSL